MFYGLKGESKWGVDIGGHGFFTDPLQECIQECDTRGDCVGFTHIVDGNVDGYNCWPKRGAVAYPPQTTRLETLRVFYKLRKYYLFAFHATVIIHKQGNPHRMLETHMFDLI